MVLLRSEGLDVAIEVVIGGAPMLEGADSEDANREAAIPTSGEDSEADALLVGPKRVVDTPTRPAAIFVLVVTVGTGPYKVVVEMMLVAVRCAEADRDGVGVETDTLSSETTRDELVVRLGAMKDTDVEIDGVVIPVEEACAVPST